MAVFYLIFQRLGQAALVAFVLATLSFVFIQILPGDIALRITVARVGIDQASALEVERIREQASLSRPMLFQYADWMQSVATGNLGRSFVSDRPVSEELVTAAGYTFRLAIIAWVLSYLIALPIGIYAGLRPNGFLDRMTAVLGATLASLPSFLVGIGLISVFVLMLRWFPPAGYRTSAHLVLPAATLALSLLPASVRIIRNAVSEVRASFYMTFARFKGLTRFRAFRDHGVRNAAIPVVTFAALQLAFLMDGFVVVETLFNYPGLGEALVKALLARDIPVIMGCSLVIGTLYAIVNLAADLVVVKLDPRRMESAVL